MSVGNIGYMDIILRKVSGFQATKQIFKLYLQIFLLEMDKMHSAVLNCQLIVTWTPKIWTESEKSSFFFSFFYSVLGSQVFALPFISGAVIFYYGNPFPLRSITLLSLIVPLMKANVHLVNYSGSPRGVRNGTRINRDLADERRDL